MSEYESHNPEELNASRDTDVDGITEQSKFLEHSPLTEQQKYDETLLRHATEMRQNIESAFNKGSIEQVRYNELLGQVEEIIRELPGGALHLKVHELAEKLKIPKERIQTYAVEAGGKTETELLIDLEKKGIHVSDAAKHLLLSDDFKESLYDLLDPQNTERRRLKQPEFINLIRLTVSDLGFLRGVITDAIYTKAKQLGLDLCSPDIGPQLRMQSNDQKWMFIAMEQIIGRDNDPQIFFLDSGGPNSFDLDASGVSFDRYWHEDDEFIFSIRK